ncbi:MAG: A24 family peptidase [Nanoarchaeota archaeon]|nr:A24 family peptidase [Nanoarchaeota archaeon]
MIDVLLVTVVLVVLACASYTDLRTKEVPDWLSYGFIVATLGVRSIYSFQDGWQIIVSGLLGFAAFYLLALLFYYTHQWGGGDSKLLMGMGAALGISYPFTDSSFTPLWFLLLLLFSGAMYGLVWLGVLAIKRRNCLFPELRTLLGNHKKFHFGMGFGSLLFLGAGVFVNSLLLVVTLLVVLYYLLLFLVAVQSCCFINEKDTKTLTEGDWLAEDVVVKGKMLLKKKTLSQNDIEKLHDHKISSVLIKEGIPFVPSFLIAYVILLFGKDLMPLMIGRMFG